MPSTLFDQIGFIRLGSISFGGAIVFMILAALVLRFETSSRLKLVLALCTGILIRLFVASRSPLMLQDWPMNDDSHYYFTIARNFVSGGGLRHDSFDSTTGFQPLFLLLIAPLFKLIPDKLLAINAVLVLQTAIGVLCATFLYQIGRLLSAPAVGLLAVGIWATSPVLLAADLNGLETNTALCLLLATVCFYLRHFVLQTGTPGIRRHVELGLLCGLSFLARIDLGFLIPLLALDVLLRNGRTQRAAALIGKLVALAAASSLPLIPWIAYNLSAAGSILPSSGQAVRFLSQAYGFHFVARGSGQPPPAFEVGHPPLAYYLGTMGGAAEAITRILHGTFPLWAGVIVVLAALAIGARRLAADLRRIAIFLVFLAAIFLAYTCYIFGQWFFVRYMLPFAVGYLLILFCASAQFAWEFGAGRMRAVRRAIPVLIPLAMGLLLFDSLQAVESMWHRNSPSTYYEVALWVNANTPRDAVIGAFQSGILGYYLERPFYGLDGKVNIDALKAMQTKTMDRYVSEKNIDYLMDWPWVLRDLFTARSANPAFLSRQKVVWRGPFVVYQLARSPAP